MFEGFFGASAPVDETRQQYRAELAKQLKAGLAENRQIDLRFADHTVVVAFTDEPILPVWREFALGEVSDAHLFVAPPDFESGDLTMVSLYLGGTDLGPTDTFIGAASTFGELINELRFNPTTQRRFNVVEPPASVYHDGLAYAFTAGDLVDI
ncbi:MAG: hypothetical protein WC054_12765 [Candidatus Nanopelagicales bacterium]